MSSPNAWLRPALADRLVTSWYAYDQRIHGELKQRAEAELKARSSVEQVKQTSGKYSESEFVRGESPRKKNHDPGHSITLSGRDWDQTMQKLGAIFGNSTCSGKRVASKGLAVAASSKAGETPKDAAITLLRTGALSPLQEDQDRYYATAILNKSNDCLKLATVSWLKEPFESWLARTGNQPVAVEAVPSIDYTLPTILSGGCVEDTWSATAGPPDGRQHHTAIWTGSEMIVWGGEVYTHLSFASGGRYNPSTDTWTITSAINAPAARAYHTAIWTGTEMIVWGGGVSDLLNTGGRYDPGTDTWTATSIDQCA